MQNQGVYRGKGKRKEKAILYGIHFDVGIHLREKGGHAVLRFLKTTIKTRQKPNPYLSTSKSPSNILSSFPDVDPSVFQQRENSTTQLIILYSGQ